jgi:hypothetical protein
VSRKGPQIEYVSAMQEALLSAAATAGVKSGAGKRVARVAQRTKLHTEPAVSTKLSYRTAKKLIAEGVIQ